MHFIAVFFLRWCTPKETQTLPKMHTKCSESLSTCYLHKDEAVELETFPYGEQHSIH